MLWFGNAEKLTNALFSFASKFTPVIVFIDEIMFTFHINIQKHPKHGETNKDSFLVQKIDMNALNKSSSKIY